MKTMKVFTPLLGRLFVKIAPRIGATVLLEPEWGVAGQITFQNGRRRYFRYSSIDLNPLGSSEISKDKDFTNYFIAQMGYPVIDGKTFFSEKWSSLINSPRNTHAGWEYANEIGLPVVVKPNSQSQGRAVTLVRNQHEFFRAMNEVFEIDRVAHGVSNIIELIGKKQSLFCSTDRDTRIKIDDPRIIEMLLHKGLSLNSVPPSGDIVYLLVNANLSSGGDAVDVTSNIHSSFCDVAIRLTRDMGLRLCGVDLIVDGDIRDEADRFWIVETNASPGLDHYANSGEAQQEIVEDLYLEVLKAMSI